MVAEAALIRGARDPASRDPVPREPEYRGPSRREAARPSDGHYEELVLVYLVPDYERYTLAEDGTLETLYIGRRYDARTLQPKGPPKRSSDPEDLRHWWLKSTGYNSSSGILK